MSSSLKTTNNRSPNSSPNCFFRKKELLRKLNYRFLNILIIYLSMTFHFWQRHNEIPSCKVWDVISRYNPFITKINWCMTYHLLRRWLLRHYKGFEHYSPPSQPEFHLQERARGVNPGISWKCWEGENTQVRGPCWVAGKPVLGKQKESSD